MSTGSAGRVCLIKAKGGMGNRMLCAASGILWARAVGRAPYVDWRDNAYSKQGENSFFHFFESPRVLREPPPETESVFPAVWRGRLGQSVSGMLHAYDPDKHSSLTIHRKYSVDPARADYPEAVAVFWYYMGRFRAVAPLARERVDGYAGLSVEQVARKALKEELPPSVRVRERIERFVAGSWPEKAVGVHVRYTDRTTDLGKLKAATREQLRRLPGAKVFLATDNRRVEEEFRREFGEVLTTPKWFPPEGAVMHQNEQCADPVANGVEALTDMYLLARCDALVYASRSTFSEISRLISEIPPDRVADVDRRDPTMIAKRMLRRLTA
ncbi:MAG TPA: nodulation protein NodZ [Phycisphaerales bacterium]|nr:nodulation protein NodZ [Phycisphaerales bacterium]